MTISFIIQYHSHFQFGQCCWRWSVSCRHLVVVLSVLWIIHQKKGKSWPGGKRCFQKRKEYKKNPKNSWCRVHTFFTFYFSFKLTLDQSHGNVKVVAMTTQTVFLRVSQLFDLLISLFMILFTKANPCRCRKQSFKFQKRKYWMHYTGWPLLLETPGMRFTPGKWLLESRKMSKSPGKLLKFYFIND